MAFDLTSKKWMKTFEDDEERGLKYGVKHEKEEEREERGGRGGGMGESVI